jgi:serine O-acetyltransferase
MFATLRADISRAMRETRDDPNWKPTWKQKLNVCLRHATWPVIAYRYSRWTLAVRIPIAAQLLRLSALLFRKWTELFTSVHIDVNAEIGPGFVIHSVYAINLGKATIGKNFTIASGCLISQACRGIGDNVYFGAGAKLIGDARIGNNVVVAANSLVLTDVRDNLMVMGVPARIRLPGGKPQRFIRKPEPAKAPVKREDPAATVPIAARARTSPTAASISAWPEAPTTFGPR